MSLTLTIAIVTAASVAIIADRKWKRKQFDKKIDRTMKDMQKATEEGEIVLQMFDDEDSD